MGTHGDRALAESQAYPKPGSAMYGLTSRDMRKRESTLGRWKLVNRYLTVPLYRIGFLPLLGLGRIFLLLTTTGRKTGRSRVTPLEYHWINGDMHIFSGRGEDSD